MDEYENNNLSQMNFSQYIEEENYESELISFFLFILVMGWFAGYTYQIISIFCRDKCKRRKHRKFLKNRLLSQRLLSNSDECSICLERYKVDDSITELPCSHLYHRSCIEQWFVEETNNNCPICRTLIV